jgi:hypothetical protein
MVYIKIREKLLHLFLRSPGMDISNNALVRARDAKLVTRPIKSFVGGPAVFWVSFSPNIKRRRVKSSSLFWFCTLVRAILRPPIHRDSILVVVPFYVLKRAPRALARRADPF